MNARLNRPCNGTEKKAQGFTLLEVLIAMSLLGIMVVLLFASLKTCAESWERGEAKIAAVNEVAVVYQFFKRHLALAVPLTNDFDPENITFAFQGEQHALKFVSAFPASAAKSGLQLFSLQRLDDEQGHYLQVTLTPFVTPQQGSALPHEDVTLIDHVKDISLVYFGNNPNSGEADWQNDWLERDSLPRLIKITIELDNGTEWPEMVIGLKVNGSQGEIGSEVMAEPGVEQ